MPQLSDAPADRLDWTHAFIKDRPHMNPVRPKDFPTDLDLRALYLQSQDPDCFKVSLADVRPGFSGLDPSALREVVADGWRSRAARSSHLELLVVGPPSDIGDRLSVFGPRLESPLLSLKWEQARALTELALSEHSRHDARRVVMHWLPELDNSPGVLNTGLFDDQRFKAFARNFNVPEDCPDLPKLDSGRGFSFFEQLGCRVVQRDEAAILFADEEVVATAVYCEAGEAIGSNSERLRGQKPLIYALSVARETASSWAIVVRNPEVWLYPVSSEVGVGGGGIDRTYAAINLSLLGSDSIKFAQMLFSYQALKAGGHLDQLLDLSHTFVVELGNGLRERIYDDTIPLIASALSQRLPVNTNELSASDLQDAFEQVMLVLFRLLFVAYSEHKGLLPVDHNHNYRLNSLSHITKDIIERRHRGEPYEADSTELWDRVNRLWTAISEGNRDWGVPAYGGSLFFTDQHVSISGWKLSNTAKLSDYEFGPALEAMLTSSPSYTSSHNDTAATSPVDFGSLSVREFGTIYEGLLESRLAVAPVDLMLDRRSNSYVPASVNGEVAVTKGSVYLQHRSGTRKSTGSYFTKPFAVDHLCDQALVPALDDHIARLNELHQAGHDEATANAFLDFRCADIAMGSGHFLVTAIDKIESRLLDWLTRHQVPRILERLDSLRESAHRALGDDVDIPTGSLLRRQVARHCIYGVDCNRVAVDLARLAVWVHTFVPGLPLSFLDHNLVYGDSLTGVASIDVADTVVRERYHGTLQRWQVLDQLTAANSALRGLTDTSDESLADIAEARRAHEEASQAVAVARAVFDLISAQRAGVSAWPEDPEDLVAAAADAKVTMIISNLRPTHFPAAFPEVFSRERPGFDCIVGNPPWEEVTVEELGFWALRFPGLEAKSLKEREATMTRLRTERPDLYTEYQSTVDNVQQLRDLLVAGPYPGMGSGDPDLYKAFCWRFWYLIRDGGRIGVVLPRSVLATKGSTEWRKAVLAEGTFDDVTTLLNNRGWVFDDVHPQYTVALCSLRKGPESDVVSMSGPFDSMTAYGQREPGTEVALTVFNSWSDTAAFPMVPSPEAMTVFCKLKEHPRLDTRSNPEDLALPVRELDATSDKSRFMKDNGAAVLKEQQGYWPVYAGKSFNIWLPDTGRYLGSVNSLQIMDYLSKKRHRQHKQTRSAFSQFSEAVIHDEHTLPCCHPRVAFRGVGRRTDSRTIIPALVPGHVVITNGAPYLIWPRGGARNEAFLLGVLSSMILDWCARRIVEININFHIFNSLPIPDVDIDTNRLAQRIINISGRLAAVDDRFRDWAGAVGVPVGSATDDNTRNSLIHELDACVARLYGLDRDDISVIYDSFHKNADHSNRKAAVLHHFERLP